MMFDKRIYALVIAFLLAACTDYSQQFTDDYAYGKSGKGFTIDYGKLKDLRDNHLYEFAQVGNLYWMMEDLAYEYYSDERYGSTYCPRSRTSECETIGFFYPGAHLDNACPEGWRLPSTEEWRTFYNSAAFSSRSYDSDFYKGLYGGDGRLSNDGEAAFYWVYDTLNNEQQRDCIKISIKDGFDKDQKCDREWKISVRCVRETDSELTTSSSSESRVSSSSRANIDAPYPCGDMWCGSWDTEGRVETGASDYSAGYWYDFNDAIHGGNSIVNFPTDVEENTYGNFFGPLVEMYMGIKGSFVFGDSYDYPYVGLAFDVVKQCKEDMFKTQKYKSSCVPQYDSFGNQSNRCPDSLSRRVGYDVLDCEKGGDISEWRGLCLVYESSSDFDIELAPEQESKVTEYDNYKAAVSNTGCCGGTPATVDIPWAEFKQGIWGKEADQAAVLSKIAAIRLRFEGSAGTTGDFYIRSIGRLGTCK